MAAAKMFNEGDFERAAYRAHNELGEASPVSIDLMLQSGFHKLVRDFREHSAGFRSQIAPGAY